MVREVFIESGVRMAYDVGAAVWSFDPALWGSCIQARTIEDALHAFERRHGPAVVVEQIEGDEQCFQRDRLPASDLEVGLTLKILTSQRRRTIRLFEGLPDALLDCDDPARQLPAWAHWGTIRANLWHIADTESRYYLPSLGLPSRERANDLGTELRASAAHVHVIVSRMPRDLVNEGTEVWTSTKLLRRLAWHEAGEVDAIEELLRGWQQRG